MPKKAQKKSATKKPSLSPYQVGKNIFIQTATYFQVGLISELNEHGIVLTKAAWIPEVGRFNEALATGNFLQVELWGETNVIVPFGAIIAACEWNHELPKVSK